MNLNKKFPYNQQGNNPNTLKNKGLKKKNMI